jgi:hypothetical protein
MSKIHIKTSFTIFLKEMQIILQKEEKLLKDMKDKYEKSKLENSEIIMDIKQKKMNSEINLKDCQKNLVNIYLKFRKH